MRRPILAGLLGGVALLIVLDALGARLGWVAGAWPRATGPWPWYASRAAGVTAFIALTLDVLFGLLLSTGAADRWIARARTVEIHRWLSSATLTLVGLHALLLLADHVVRFDVLDALVPFTASYRPTAVALGVLGAYVALAVHATFALRARLGARWWRRLHHGSFVAFGLALAHALTAGSDAAAGWSRAIYVGAGGLVLVLLWRRLRGVPCRGCGP